MTINELKSHCEKTLSLDAALRHNPNCTMQGSKVKDEHELILELIDFYEKHNTIPEGKWILVDPLRDGNKQYMCSNCKTCNYFITPDMITCPWCGSYNRRKNE